MESHRDAGHGGLLSQEQPVIIHQVLLTEVGGGVGVETADAGGRDVFDVILVVHLHI